MRETQMVAVDRESITKEVIHKAVDELSAESLVELATFIGYLKYKHQVQQQGSPWAKELYDLFAPVREAVAQSGLTEEEINQLIDDELEAFRREQNA
jgi:hypothetical protein